MKKSQANLENQLDQRKLEVEAGNMSPKEAFGNIKEWVTDLGGRKVFLHPQLEQWMWYDRIHDEWVFAECGVGEGILLTINSTGGVKKLPSKEKVEKWCVSIENDKLYGPILINDLYQKLESGKVPTDIQIWSPRCLDWFAANSELGKTILNNSVKAV